jgi:hypothetical protein
LKATPGSLAFKSTGGVCHVLFNSSIPANFTTTAGANQAMIKTVGGTLLNMFTSACIKKIYFVS